MLLLSLETELQPARDKQGGSPYEGAGGTARGVLRQDWQNQGQVLPFTHQDGHHAMSLCVKDNHCVLLDPLCRDQSWEKASTHMCAPVSVLVPEWRQYTCWCLVRRGGHALLRG